MEPAETPPSRGSGERWFTIVLMVAIAVMAVELILLVRQNRRLQATVARMGGEAPGSAQSMPALEPGDTVDPLEARTLAGVGVRIAYDDPDRETVLLIFSPDCPACRGNMERWKELVEAHRDDESMRFYYVSTTDREATRSFAAEHDLKGSIVVVDRDALMAYNIRHIPTTVVVKTGGVVEDVVVGAVPGGWLTAAGNCWSPLPLRSSST